MQNYTKCWKVWKSTQKAPIHTLLTRFFLPMRPNWPMDFLSLQTQIKVTLTSVVVLQSVRRTRMWMRSFSTMPHPLPSSKGIKIASHYIFLFLLQDWYAQLCAKPHTDPKNYGHLPTLNHQGPSVSSLSIKICSGVLRTTTMHFIYPRRTSTCMRIQSHQQGIGDYPDWAW